ncbi:MAG: hypothetical protein K0U98_23160 [Deltaproteobacteria bacterium]|nr:hypothetical protein [Deltaproteobacteria bacterium]
MLSHERPEGNAQAKKKEIGQNRVRSRPDHRGLKRLVGLAVFVFVALGAGAISAPPPSVPGTGSGDLEIGDSSQGFPGRVGQLSLEELEAHRPYWPNPYLSFLPREANPDLEYWQALLERRAEQRRAEGSRRGGGTSTEIEPNNTLETSNHITVFGSGPGKEASVDVSGHFAAPSAPLSRGPFVEDEGSIPLASETGLVAGSAVKVSGTIGDGPFGSSGTGSGDLDFYRIPAVEVGQLIVIDVDTPLPFGDLDSFIGLYDSAGNSLALNEDENGGGSLDSFLAIPITVAGDYFLSIGGSLFPFASVLSDPFDSSSGFGVGSEGDYEVTIALEYGDPDWFSFDLEACDILGIQLIDAGEQVLLKDPSGELLVASSQDLTGIFPPASPLPGGGETSLSYLAPEAGRYSIRALAGNDADYTLELRLFRPFLTPPADNKVIFVDFDGATVDPAIFTGPAGDTDLSPFADFLPRWGLSAQDEDAAIDSILASLEENLVADPRSSGPNGGFDVQLLNSRDHPDPFGQPGVSRLIIGGSISELGIPTIGIAQSIDPGNFAREETAVILLDLLSGAAPDPNSLNTFPLAPGISIIDLLGVALGNIAAHEAGHYLGNFHTEQFNPLANLMDRGGNLPNTIGVGPDGIFGNEDDSDVDFGEDAFEVTERFAGVEDTLTVVSCGCTTSVIFADDFESGDLSGWSASFP